MSKIFRSLIFLFFRPIAEGKIIEGPLPSKNAEALTNPTVRRLRMVEKIRFHARGNRGWDGKKIVCGGGDPSEQMVLAPPTSPNPPNPTLPPAAVAVEVEMLIDEGEMVMVIAGAQPRSNSAAAASRCPRHRRLPRNWHGKKNIH